MLGQNNQRLISLTGEAVSRLLIQRILPLYGDSTDYTNPEEYSLKALEQIKSLQYKISDLKNRKYVISQQNLLKVLEGYIKKNRFIGKIGRKEKFFLLLLCKGPQEMAYMLTQFYFMMILNQ